MDLRENLDANGIIERVHDSNWFDCVVKATKKKTKPWWTQRFQNVPSTVSVRQGACNEIGKCIQFRCVGLFINLMMSCVWLMPQNFLNKFFSLWLSLLFLQYRIKSKFLVTVFFYTNLKITMTFFFLRFILYIYKTQDSCVIRSFTHFIVLFFPKSYSS